MSSRGPVPKRPDERRRRNRESVPDVVRLPRGDRPEPGVADPDWHPRVRALYGSLVRSGQAEFYEPSDFEMAAVACEVLSRELERDKLNANALAVVLGVMSSLLATEGDRRRARLILERADVEEDPPSVALMDRYRKAANGASA